MVRLLLLVWLIALTGCGQDAEYNYDTHADYEKLKQLRGKTIAILSFDHDESAFKNTDTLEASFADTLNDTLKRRFIEKYNSLFKIVDLSEVNRITAGGTHAFPATSLLKEQMKKHGAEGCILVVNSYGYKMKGASGVLWAVLEKLVPEEHKKTYRAALSHSEVERYYFASNHYLLDSNGNVIWNFAGKASVYPSVDFSLNEFMRSFAGMDPSSQKVADVMLESGSYYFDYNLWLIQ